MTMRSPNFVLIGSGRLATHLRYYLSLHDVQVRLWSRNASSDFNSISRKEIPDENERLGKTLSEAEVVLLAIADGALPAWVERPEFAGKRIVHFSGAQHFANAWGFHPLMSFTHQLYPAEFYPTIPFIADKGFAWTEVFPFLRNPVYAIDPMLKPFYHALCHMAANFPALLWVQVLHHFENDLKLPSQALQPILEKVLSNTMERGEKALAGPLRRGDLKTLEMHDQALENHPSLQTIYDLWTEWALTQRKKPEAFYERA